MEESVEQAVVAGRQRELPLPIQSLEYVSAWGGASGDICYVFRPSTIEQLRHVFQTARDSGAAIGFRGSGNSYGDAALNAENILVDMRRMDRILSWNPDTGMIIVEPGVTIEQLWQYVLGDGWWVPVATGTAKTSIGGCLAMNVHGKNAWQLGPIGDHVLQFDLMLPSGEIITCSRDVNSDIFHAAIGGFGMLGCIISVSLKMKRVYSGNLRVEAYVSRNIGHMLQQIDDQVRHSDYTVGWGDAFARGPRVGRGQIHVAHYLPPGADPYPQQTLRLQHQLPPEFLFGVVPASIVWIFMRPFWNNLGTRLVNTAKYITSALDDGKVYQQSHVKFHFLLDYVPNWKKAYGSGGLIQYQPFIPAEYAEDAFHQLLLLGQKYRLPNYLTVVKRHRTDSFLMSHGLDGYSMAMDYRITRRNRERIVELCRAMDEIVLRYGGRFYFAKDSTLRPEVVQAYLGQEAIQSFRQLKQRCDPEGMLETNLWRRLFV